MHRLPTVLIALSLAASPAVFAAAQQPTPSGAQGMQKTDSMLKGCLRAAAPGGTNSPGDTKIYTLDVNEPVAPPAASPTTGTATTRAAVLSPTTYSLTAAESVGLAKHVNHEVELTGRMQTSGPAKPAPGTGTPESTKPTAGGAHRTFEVTALKMVSTNCP